MDCRLYAVRVFVTDWERAMHFYTDTLGIPLESRDDEQGWALLATGEGRLAIERVAPDDEEGRQLVGRFVGASLLVQDMAAEYEALVARGTTFISPPTPQPWGGTLAHVGDPDGNVITLVSGIDRPPAPS